MGAGEYSGGRREERESARAPERENVCSSEHHTPTHPHTEAISADTIPDEKSGGVCVARVPKSIPPKNASALMPRQAPPAPPPSPDPPPPGSPAAARSSLCAGSRERRRRMRGCASAGNLVPKNSSWRPWSFAKLSEKWTMWRSLRRLVSESPTYVYNICMYVCVCVESPTFLYKCVLCVCACVYSRLRLPSPRESMCVGVYVGVCLCVCIAHRLLVFLHPENGHVPREDLENDAAIRPRIRRLPRILKSQRPSIFPTQSHYIEDF